MTVKEMLDECIARVGNNNYKDPGAARSRAIALTKLEEAQMWYTRARAIETHKFNPQDLDK